VEGGIKPELNCLSANSTHNGTRNPIPGLVFLKESSSGFENQTLDSILFLLTWLGISGGQLR